MSNTYTSSLIYKPFEPFELSSSMIFLSNINKKIGKETKSLKWIISDKVHNVLANPSSKTCQNWFISKSVFGSKTAQRQDFNGFQFAQRRWIDDLFPISFAPQWLCGWNLFHGK